MQQERYIATADLGTSKIALSVVKINGDKVDVLYYKESESDGIRYSTVFNPMRAAEPLKSAIREAEKELDIKISQIILGLPRYSVRQESNSAKIERSNPGSCVLQEEIDSLKGMALDSYPLSDEAKEEIYGAVAQSFCSDDTFQGREEDIVGSPSDILEGNFKVFIGAKKAVTNLDTLMNNVGVAIAEKCFLPVMTANAVLTSQERDNGVALIEMGAGVTSLTIYQNDILRYYGSIPFGGRNITNDIKYECGFHEHLAENLKLGFGACLPEKLQNMSEKIIQINDDESASYPELPVKYLSEIITSRAREIFEAILYMIQESGYADRLRNGIVLTGGGANLTNLSNLLKEMSGYNVRIGYPRTKSISFEGCSGICETSAAATVGMILAARDKEFLNCMDAPGFEERSVVGTVFEHKGGEDVREGKNTKAEKPEKPKTPRKTITWGTKINSGLEKALGNLFDGMDSDE